ncbi:MAG: glycoside hydrolase family 5 protein [Oscillospiraceae bacterium]|nr:glycoside hydrolase family 5 protein [Oscillospiraceae bacterium]
MKKLLSFFTALVICLCLNLSLTAFATDNEMPTNGFDTDKTSAQIAREMKIGWNLGNTLDSWDGSGLDSETSWGNPKTTEKMILDIKAMGFNTVRVPVTWSIHADSKGNIDSEWMARVKEVVDYAYDNDMYVILNSHHDDSYFDIGGCLSNEDTYAENIEKTANLWRNIANTFKDYDERLVFETMNEPRTVGSENEWLGGTDEEYKIVFALNDAIVKAIRATGGNNAYRHIMVPAYAATPLTKVLRKMELPEDDRIIVSIHAYSPYSFAMDENGATDFTKSDKKELDKFFSDLNKIFISKGIPVVIGEFGATNKNNLEDRCKWAEYYVKGAGQYGIPCAVWDNNIGTESGAECWGLYDRATGEWVFPEIAETMVKSADGALKNTEINNAQKTSPDVTLPIIFAVIAVVILILIIILIKQKNRGFIKR